MRVILAGGGTGGHIYPAVTLAYEFMKRDPQTEILFVGGKRGLESDIIPKEGFKLVTLNLAGIPRKLTLDIFKSLWLAGKGVMETFEIVKEFKPDVVIGTGGYVCGPMVLAAALSGVPTAIQEQNAFPGVTNRMLGKVVRRIFTAYPEAGDFFNQKKIRILGNPIRSAEFSTVTRAESEAVLGLKPNCMNLLVFGGSQSAQKVNQAFLPLIPELLRDNEHLQVMLMTGTKEYEKTKKIVTDWNLSVEIMERIHLAPYFYKMAQVYKATDLVIARAGALSLAEITCFGIPAILIPYPYATNNHQEFNARVLEKNRAALVLSESELTSEKLQTALFQIANSPNTWQLMSKASLSLSRPNAAADIVSELQQLIMDK